MASHAEATFHRDRVTTLLSGVRARDLAAGPRSRGIAVAVLLFLGPALLISPPAAASAEVLRESYAPGAWANAFANVWVNQKVAQSFVARTDFLLTHAEIYAFDQPETTGPDILQLSVATDAGNRPGAILGTTAKQGLQNWTWIAFGFYPWVPLEAGQRYWIVAEDSQPRPKGYEWAMNSPGGYAPGEAQWFDSNAGSWVNGTGADLFFKVFGVSGPSLLLEVEPTLVAVNPGTSVPLTIYFNNSGNDLAGVATISVDLPEGLTYVADDASLEGGTASADLTWTFRDVPPGSHGMTLWTTVDPDPAYFDGQSLVAYLYLNYTDSDGQRQIPSWDAATVSVLVPVIRVQAVPTPSRVDVGEIFNFSVSFYNLGSGPADTLWLNASAGPRTTILGDDAASAGAVEVGPNAWRFRNVSAQTYVFNVTVQAAADALPGDRLILRLNATYTDGGGHPFASRAAQGLAAIHGPSVVVEAVADTATVHPGDTFHMVLYANNTGDAEAGRLWINATIPSGLSLEDSQPAPSTQSGDRVGYDMTDVLPGGHAITLGLRVDGNLTPGVVLETRAALDVTTSAGTLLRPSAAMARQDVVTPLFVLSLGASASQVATGDTFGITLRWTNTGNEAARRVWFNFTLPAKILLVSSSMPWTATDGTTFAWEFVEAAPGNRTILVAVQVNGPLTNGEGLRAQLELRYERTDRVLSPAQAVSLDLEGVGQGSVAPGFEIVLLWIAVLAAVFLLFLLLGYMDVLPRRRSQIEDIFLLHNSGILICHYSTTLRPDVDSDIASGMLMAVRNFVADALRSKNGSLQELRYGEHRIHMVHGRDAVLVTFSRGGSGKNLEARMTDVLRDIETAYASVLESWSGRTEDFRGVEEILRRLIDG